MNDLEKKIRERYLNRLGEWDCVHPRELFGMAVLPYFVEAFEHEPDAKRRQWLIELIWALIQQSDYQAARNYWKVLKNRLKKEGSQSVTKCNRLKLEAADGKKYITDAATPETLLR